MIYVKSARVLEQGERIYITVAWDLSGGVTASTGEKEAAERLSPWCVMKGAAVTHSAPCLWLASFQVPRRSRVPPRAAVNWRGLVVLSRRRRPQRVTWHRAGRKPSFASPVFCSQTLALFWSQGQRADKIWCFFSFCMFLLIFLSGVPCRLPTPLVDYYLSLFRTTR